MTDEDDQKDDVQVPRRVLDDAFEVDRALAPFLGERQSAYSVQARDADLGIAAGRGKGHLFVKGQVVRVVPEAEMVDALIEEAERIVTEGVEARLADADADAAAVAAATRDELLQIQGHDANQADDRIARIREITE